MSPLLQAKLVNMLVLCFFSVVLGLVPIKLVKLFDVKIGSCGGDSAEDAEQPLVVSLLLCFGGGVLLFATFLHLLPEVRQHAEILASQGRVPSFFTEHHGVPLADLVVCVGFFLVYAIEEAVHAILDCWSVRQRSADQLALQRAVSLRRCSSSKKRRRSKMGRTTTTSDDPDENKVVLPTSTSTASGYTTTSKTLLGVSVAGGTTLLPLLKNHDASALSSRKTTMNESDNSSADTMPSSSPTTTRKSFRGLLTILALSFHEVFEGFAVGLERNVHNVWYLLVAIATHKFVLAFCLGVELLSMRTQMWLLVLYVCTFAVVTPIGVVVGILLSPTETTPAADGDDKNTPQQASLVSVLLEGIAVGTLVYVTFFELLQREKSSPKSGVLQLLAIVSGFVFMIGLQFILV